MKQKQAQWKRTKTNRKKRTQDKAHEVDRDPETIETQRPTHSNT